MNLKSSIILRRLGVKTLEIPVQVSVSFDEDEEMLEVYDHHDTDSSSDEMDIQL